MLPIQKYAAECYEGNKHFYYLWPHIPGVFKTDCRITWDCKEPVEQLTYDEYIETCRRLNTNLEDVENAEYYYAFDGMENEVIATSDSYYNPHLCHRISYHEYIDRSI